MSQAFSGGGGQRQGQRACAQQWVGISFIKFPGEYTGEQARASGGAFASTNQTDYSA